MDFDYVIPMDGDGEDRPEELSLFYCKRYKDTQNTVITAIELKDLKGFIFKFCYFFISI